MVRFDDDFDGMTLVKHLGKIFGDAMLYEMKDSEGLSDEEMEQTDWTDCFDPNSSDNDCYNAVILTGTAILNRIFLDGHTVPYDIIMDILMGVAYGLSEYAGFIH